MLEALLTPFQILVEMRHLGGPVVLGIFAACVLMWTIVMERLWFFTGVLPRQAERLLQEWQARPEHHSWRAHQIRKAMISTLNAGMNSNIQLLRVLVPMCPLLGLLGTVSGMLAVFDAMSARGSADARSMANGVSEAMICTLTGLAVSITGLYPVYYFRRRIRHETERLADKFTF
ncbi:biopolymer transport protein ExbB [Hydrocarboniphaga daqingensis]|jgi:biopolymer transport protein ExbB|uniref:Biopolymer transport protein ExbB n=1 Tax=Hydrocarboniphaga daqingensis TaxID=490188 RepID=A0A1M5NY40_9GAMM|nr:MotA/TolQ/ExbB proton channel family protein [Hydrocarboniphaga daqingensis]SHG94450.1 biopolymer transport protein ExbB [Hydrocarboniphaga daqingensis]